MVIYYQKIWIAGGNGSQQLQHDKPESTDKYEEAHQTFYVTSPIINIEP